MPYVIRPKLRNALAGAVLSAALLASFVLPAAADAACPATPTSQPFKPWSDYSHYSLVPNGHFESGTSGWSLTKAAVVSGNESYKVRAATDSRSLSIQPGGVAVSPAFCVGGEHPTFRFFARRTSGSSGDLYAKLRWTRADGARGELMVWAASGASFRSWAPTPPLALANALMLWHQGGSLSVRLVFAASSGGTWAIDDVYIDPYRR